jgi:hypothetical protein
MVKDCHVWSDGRNPKSELEWDDKKWNVPQ